MIGPDVLIAFVYLPRIIERVVRILDKASVVIDQLPWREWRALMQHFASTLKSLVVVIVGLVVMPQFVQLVGSYSGVHEDIVGHRVIEIVLGMPNTTEDMHGILTISHVLTICLSTEVMQGWGFVRATGKVVWHTIRSCVP